MMGMKKRIGKRGGGGVMKKRMKRGGDVKKKKNPGLAKLPKKVRNKMGFMKRGGKVNG